MISIFGPVNNISFFWEKITWVPPVVVVVSPLCWGSACVLSLWANVVAGEMKNSWIVNNLLDAHRGESWLFPPKWAPPRGGWWRGRRVFKNVVDVFTFSQKNECPLGRFHQENLVSCVPLDLCNFYFNNFGYSSRRPLRLQWNAVEAKGSEMF